MNAKRDDNRVLGLLGVSILDFATCVTIAVNPVTHGVICYIV